MSNRIFPRYPDQWKQNPEVLSARIGAIEDHLEQSPPSINVSPGLLGYIPALLLWALGLLGLVSPEQAASVLRALGH